MKTISLLLLGFIFTVSTFGQTTGTLDIKATTSTAGGNFAPKNIVAIWIEDDAGNFVKTLLAYAATRKTYLNTWQASTSDAGSEYNTVDAITGATQSNHGTRTCTWDGTDFSGNLVDDGSYYVWMELTDKNGTGNFSSFNFTKTDQNQELTPDNVPSFSDISITWTADATNISNEILANVNVWPNPSADLFYFSGILNPNYKIFSLSGKLISEGIGNDVNLTNMANGVYIISIWNEKYSPQQIRIVKGN